jgi:hypothetical protein
MPPPCCPPPFPSTHDTGDPVWANRRRWADVSPYPTALTASARPAERAARPSGVGGAGGAPGGGEGGRGQGGSAGVALQQGCDHGPLDGCARCFAPGARRHGGQLLLQQQRRGGGRAETHGLGAGCGDRTDCEPAPPRLRYRSRFPEGIEPPFTAAPCWRWSRGWAVRLRISGGRREVFACLFDPDTLRRCERNVLQPGSRVTFRRACCLGLFLLSS